jgi:hypothetical protein
MVLAARLSALIGWAGAGSVLILMSLFVTNPGKLGPVGVTIWFVVFLSVIFAILSLALYFAKIFLKLHENHSTRLRYSMRQGLLLSFWITALLALSSLGQYGPKDAILLGLLLLIIELYVRLRYA